MERLPACPACGEKRATAWRKGADLQHRTSAQRFLYQRCRVCEARYLNPRPQEAEVAALYPSDYAPHRSRLNPKWLEPTDSLPPLVQSLHRYHAQFGSGSTFLDYGCGSPMFLDLMKHLGWNTIGADFSPAVTKTVREAGHQAITIAHYSDLQALEDESIRLIVLNHVFEHLYHPREVLELFYKKLIRGGVLHIVVPNPAGVSSSLFGSNWWGLEAPRHVILYSPRSLCAVLKKGGFVPQTPYHEVLTKDMNRSFGYTLQRLGIARHKPISGFAHSRLLSRLHSVVCKWAARFGYSDRFHIVGVK